MISTTIKPQDKIIKFITPSETIGKLKVTISIYDAPVMSTDEADIYTVVTIDKQMADGYMPYGQWLYPNIFTDEDCSVAFLNINSNPVKFKNK